MAISHVCNSCGVDLARVTPFVDPSLNLPVVVCANCERASVRRRHPISVFWSKARRADTALSIIVIQSILAAVQVFLITGMIWALTETAVMYEQSAIGFAIGAFSYDAIETASGAMIARQRDGLDIAFLVTGAICAISGIWLTATMAHIRLANRWAGWIGLLFVCLSLDWVGWGYMQTTELLAPDHVRSGRFTIHQADELLEAWVIRISLLFGGAFVMLAASPLGLPARWVLRIFRGGLWRKQLRRARYAKGRDE